MTHKYLPTFFNSKELKFLFFQTVQIGFGKSALQGDKTLSLFFLPKVYIFEKLTFFVVSGI